MDGWIPYFMEEVHSLRLTLPAEDLVWLGNKLVNLCMVVRSADYHSAYAETRLSSPKLIIKYALAVNAQSKSNFCFTKLKGMRLGKNFNDNHVSKHLTIRTYVIILNILMMPFTFENIWLTRAPKHRGVAKKNKHNLKMFLFNGCMCNCKITATAN